MGIRYSVNDVFFDTWTRESAYFLGYIFADGSLENSPSIRGKYVRASSTDLALLESLRTHLESKHTIVESRKKTPHKRQWMIRIGSTKLYESLVRRGVTPRKSLTMAFPNVPNAYLFDFVRGYFDGDGCVYFEKGMNKKGQLITKRLRIIFTSGSKDFLYRMNEVLCVLSPRLSTGRLYTSNTVHRLVFPTDASVVLFVLMYGGVPKNIVLQRKAHTFLKYFKTNPHRVDAGVAHIMKIMAQW